MLLLLLRLLFYVLIVIVVQVPKKKETSNSIVFSSTMGAAPAGAKCHNPSFGLTTKLKACKVAGQEGSSRVTSHAPKSAKECEGMNPHIPK
jgi:hypothetical protein